MACHVAVTRSPKRVILALGIGGTAGSARIIRSAVLAIRENQVAILAESALSFLGFGVPPPTPSWGAVLSGISMAVFGFKMLGDTLRDLLHPKLRGGPQGRS